MTGINALIRETLESERTPSARWVHGEKVPSMKQEALVEYQICLHRP